VNNFYYNPLDWSKHNRIGIALSESAYLLSEGKEIVEIDRYSRIPITCIKFHHLYDMCFIGESTGRVEVYNNEVNRKVRQMNIHYDRVGVIQKADSDDTFLSGSKDTLIKLNDIRVRKADVVTLEKHKGEVCGLSLINSYVASGGNDSRVLVWDLRRNCCINEIKEHNSAVKAVAWCPWKASLLATGGGSQDKKIVLWNGYKNIVETKIDTKSQIVAIEWKESTKQLVSGHYEAGSGFCNVWDGNKVQLKLKGHRKRLLALKLNPNNHD
jgi:WD40 repeat protein